MEQKPTVSQIGLKYGLITGLVLAAYTLILLLTDLSTNTWLSSASFIVLIVGMVIAHKAFKNEGDGFMAYGQGLGIGTIVAGIGGAVSSVFSYIYMKFIDTNYMNNVVEKTRADLQAQGMDDDQIDQVLEMSASFRTPEMSVIIGIVVFIIIGFIIALIVSAFTKNTNPELEM